MIKAKFIVKPFQILPMIVIIKNLKIKDNYPSIKIFK